MLPLPPEHKEMKSEMEIYARFMRHLRLVPNSQMEIKVLSAIQFTADILNESDAYVAKALVDLGLRAPRKAFPATYLEFVDKSLLRSGLELGGPTQSASELRAHWNAIGEDKFAAARYDFPVAEQTFFIET
jgi:hypothetical protein